MKVFIADQSQIVRARIMNILADNRNITIVGSARSISDVLNGISRLRPDILFLDARLCSGCSIDLLRLMKTPLPDLQIIVVTDHAAAPVRTRHPRGFAGADFLIDASSDLGRIADILGELSSRSN